jgi:YHS domain-containing protein
MSSPRDPVCGMPVDGGTSIVADLAGTRFRFCSEFCRRADVDHAYASEEGVTRA